MAEYKNTAACDTCPMHIPGNLVKLGINMKDFDFVVGLAGNPNTGKSTVFNSLTGLKQHTGNWAGKTVTRAEGGFKYDESKYKLVDLPGTYSLLSTSTDEEIARDFILFGQPDVTVIVADATRLERNLNLILQVLEITERVVVCLNLVDEAKRRSIEIDERALSRELGVPVIPTVARQSQGIPELLKYINDVAKGRYVCKPRRITEESGKVNKAVDKLAKLVESEYPNLPNPRWVALRLLEGDQSIINALKTGELGSLSKPQNVEPETELERV